MIVRTCCCFEQIGALREPRAMRKLQETRGEKLLF